MALVRDIEKDIMLEKIPPQNLEAEMAVLGSMLIEDDAVGGAIELLEEAYFYNDAHKKIFASILNLYNVGKAIDLVTLTEELKRRGALEVIGGAAYLTTLTATVPTAANIAYYAKIVKEKALLRSLINTSTQIVAECYDASQDPDFLLDKAESAIFEIASHKIRTEFVSLKEIIHSSIDTIERLTQRKESVTGIATGFSELDAATAGLQSSELIVVAGRPSMGKSALMTCIAEHAGVVRKVPTAIFSMEMAKEQLVQRMLCSHAKVESQKIRTGFVSQSDWVRLTNAAGKFSEAPIFIDDSPGMSVLELRAKARRLKSRHNIGLIFLDYLQLMQGPARIESRQQEISGISRALKALAKELNLPVVAVSQLSRAPEQRSDFRPRLSDLRESGAIEQDADVVMLLFREEFYTPQENNRGKTEIIIAKQRNGPTGTVRLVFLKEFTRFESLARREE